MFYELGLDSVTDGLAAIRTRRASRRVARSCSSRSVCASACSCRSDWPLFRRLTPYAEEYVAWGWAVNGFFSVIGSVLTTMLSMTFGFRAVQLGAVAMYAIAVLAYRQIDRRWPIDAARSSMTTSNRRCEVAGLRTCTRTPASAGQAQGAGSDGARMTRR